MMKLQWAMVFLLIACTPLKQRERAKEYRNCNGKCVSFEEWANQGSSGVIVTSLIGGITREETYYQGALHGEVRHFYPYSSVVREKKEYEKNCLISSLKYNENGILIKQTLFSPQKKEVLRWFNHGGPRSTEEYDILSNQKWLCRGKYFSWENEEESVVLNGEGQRTKRKSDGTLFCRDDIEKKQLKRRTFYNSNATPSVIEPYVRGKIEGVRSVFDEAGSPLEKQEWKAGEQHGWTYRLQQGEIVNQIRYHKGKKNGTEIKFQDNAIVESITWKEGRQHGPFFAYANGKPVFEEWYCEGRRVPKWHYYAHEKLFA